MALWRESRDSIAIDAMLAAVAGMTVFSTAPAEVCHDPATIFRRQAPDKPTTSAKWSLHALRIKNLLFSVT